MNLHEKAWEFQCDKGPRRMVSGAEAEALFGPGMTGSYPHGHGYTRAYEREFYRFGVHAQGLQAWAAEEAAVDCAPRLLEIGVQGGNSMRLWDWYLPEYWTIVGLEIKLDQRLVAELPKVLEHPERLRLEEGDSTLPLTAHSIRAKYGFFDIVIDDGSHFPGNQVKTLQAFWPLVRPGGIYCLEDLHESYWPEGISSQPVPEGQSHGSIMPLLHQLTEDCVGRGKFAEWSGVPAADPVVRPAEQVLFAVRFYRNMVVLEKRA